MAGTLATFAIFAAEQFLLVPLNTLGGVRMEGKTETFPCGIHGEFEIFQIVCVTTAATRSIEV